MTTKSLKEQLRVHERLLLLQALQLYPTRCAAAKGLHISLRTLFYKLRLHDLPYSDHKKADTVKKVDTCAVPPSDASC